MDYKIEDLVEYAKGDQTFLAMVRDRFIQPGERTYGTQTFRVEAGPKSPCYLLQLQDGRYEVVGKEHIRKT